VGGIWGSEESVGVAAKKESLNRCAAALKDLGFDLASDGRKSGGGHGWSLRGVGCGGSMLASKGVEFFSNGEKSFRCEGLGGVQVYQGTESLSDSHSCR
jgi:hypothetical protein